MHGVIPLFGSAETLGVSERQRHWLIRTLEVYEGETVANDLFEVDGKLVEFDMCSWVCCSAACMGGTACLLSGDPKLFHPTTSLPRSLYNLFHSWGGVPVSLAEGARALRKWLTTGDCPTDWAVCGWLPS